MQLTDLREKKIGILGLGVENEALLAWLIKYDISDDITVLDEKQLEIKNYKLKIKTKFGGDYLEGLEKFDILFRTPGIPFLSKEIQDAKKAGVEISSATKLFFDLLASAGKDGCPAKIIGVTGTKGKGTTATLISRIINNQRVFLGSNIGISPFEFLDDVKPDDIVVLELSSFQLQDLDKSPHVAVVLNITSDHLEIHQNQQEYLDAKFNIVKYQTKNDFAVINADYLTSVEFAGGTNAHTVWFSTKKSIDEGSFVQDGKIILRKNDQDFEICKTSELKLIGKHNWENVCAACAVAGILDIEPKIIREAVVNFRGLEHRLELVRELNNVKYYNDSISTNPQTTIAAIKSFPENGIHLILGGSSKGADFSELVAEIKNAKNIKSIIFLGDGEAMKIRKMVERPRFAKASQGKQIKLINAKNMDEALRKTKELAKGSTKGGDVVLLSPACASFDLFENYKKRGEAFKNAVFQLS